MTAFLGMRGNGDWSDSDMRPKNWRETILYLYPNGQVPLTAILSKMSKESTDDPEFKWWTQGLPTQAAAVTGVYTDSALATDYVSGGVAGTVLYLKMAAASIPQFRAGHQVLLRYTSAYTVDVNGKILTTVTNGASSYIAVRLLEDDDNSSSNYLAECDYVLVVGNINPEGGSMPDAIAYDPTKYTNYTQIFRTPLSITRTARMTRLRTGDAYKKMKREALELNGLEMEKAFIWGIPTEGTGDNGKPERTTGGLIYNIVNNGGVVSDFATQSDFTDTTWLDSGEEWLDYQLEQVFRYGSQEKLCFCGSGVLLQINKLIKEYGNYNFTSMTKSYGLKVTEWVTPFGVINLMTHPLFSYESTNRNTAVIFEPGDLLYRYITDTTFYPDPDKQNTGRGRIDGTDEEFLTEAGLEFHHPSKCAYLNGFGSDNGTP
jgi:hypothetical protein